jgi:hypothetical protein
MEVGEESVSHLERGHHLALFLAVYEIIVVLHRNEGRETIVYRVICSAEKRKKHERARVNQLSNPFFTDNIGGAYFASDGLVKGRREERRF